MSKPRAEHDGVRPARHGPSPVLAIAGAAGSGKSTLADALDAALGVPVVRLDDCYHTDPAVAPSVARYDGDGRVVYFSDPDAIDLGRVHAAVAAHGGAGLVVVEGIFALTVDAVRAAARWTVYLDTPPDVSIARKTLRKIGEGRDAGLVLRGFLEHGRAAGRRAVRHALSPRHETRHRMRSSPLLRTVAVVGQVALGVLLLVAGVGHLTVAREEFRAQVPSWVPVGADLVVVASGVVEVCLGLALLAVWRQPARGIVGAVAGAFFVAVFPGNIAQYLEHKDGFGLDTDAKRAVRLLFQPLLVAWALATTGAVAALRSLRRSQRPG